MNIRKILRKSFMKSMIEVALAVRILYSIKVWLKIYIASYSTRFVRAVSSYFLTTFITIILGLASPSYLPFLFFFPPYILAAAFQKKLSEFPSGEDSRRDRKHRCKKPRRKPKKCESCFSDRVEDLTEVGPSAAAYVRVSTGRQAKEGYSLMDPGGEAEELGEEVGDLPCLLVHRCRQIRTQA